MQASPIDRLSTDVEVHFPAHTPTGTCQHERVHSWGAAGSAAIADFDAGPAGPGKGAPTGPAELSVYDLSGRRVRSLSSPAGPSGSVLWDGRTDAGADAAPGVYFIRYRQGGRESSTRVHLVR